VYDGQGKYEQALEAYSKSLDIKIKIVGSGHPEVADTKRNMAFLHKKRGERTVAKQLYLECEAIYAKVLGAEDINTMFAAQQARDCA
jgi:tetratricopeptide (TPR) repeat protein